MMPKATVQTIDLGDGRTITLETGKLAKQAHGSCMVTMGNTMLLATVVSNEEAKEGVDFLPLTVDYREKFAAAGKFPGGFFKREARPSEAEILTSRLVDRALRPIFPSDYHADTQVMITMYSSDDSLYPDSLAALAASSAITLSDLPFGGPISEVRVGRVDGSLVINPTREQLASSNLDMIIAATLDNIVMLEGQMEEISEAEMLEVIRFAHDAIKVQCQAQLDLSEAFGKKETREYSHETHDEELRADVRKDTFDKIYAFVSTANPNKYERSKGLKAIRAEYCTKYSAEELSAKIGLIKVYYHDLEKEAVRKLVLDTRVRMDGRKLDEIRPIWSEIDILPGTHGSAVFTRGETQSLTTITLGNKMDEQTMDTALGKGSSRFMLHYNFPSFSTGEARPNRGTSRREIGHGNLAQRALKGSIPADCPYTIRVISDILESNGSSSMATVCAGSMAMMDAGVKVTSGVSGIAMGLIYDEETKKYAVLSDILGDEDHLGDMDFKVTGTPKGITACQMDIKINGLSYDVLTEALEQAKAGRAHILAEMQKTIAEPKEDYKPHAPRIVQLVVPKEFIGAIIGPGGKVIQEMQAETGTHIMIEEVGDTGVVDISGTNKESIDAAIQRIKEITAIPEEGAVYKGKVKSVKDFGAFVEFMPGKEGLLHISEITWERLETMDGIFDPGDEIDVKLVQYDKVSGKFRLSAKVLKERPEGMPEPSADRRGGGDRGGDRRGGGDRRRDDRGGDRRRDDRGGDRRGGFSDRPSSDRRDDRRGDDRRPDDRRRDDRGGERRRDDRRD
jgi:polyribonucleotide nucleotidyltransferase